MQHANDIPQDSAPLTEAVRQCSNKLLAELADIYAQADAEILSAGPECRGCGECCRFDVSSHRLYLSTGELALLAGESPTNPANLAGGLCPYQLGPQCSARDRRPLGCRTFFCQTDLSALQQSIYEKYHQKIRLLHQQHRLPYLYLELVSALAELLG